MTKKNVTTANTKTEAEESGEYGGTVYLTINASNNYYAVAGLVKEAIAECAEYKSVLYLNVNSGNPPVPPICPPGDPRCQG